MKGTKIIIDGETYSYRKGKDLFSDLLTIINVKYSPFETYKENMIKVMELIIEFCSYENPPDKRSTINFVTKINKYIRKVKNRKQLMIEHYNWILALDGFGLLRGFSVKAPIPKRCNFNPERFSIMGAD